MSVLRQARDERKGCPNPPTRRCRAGPPCRLKGEGWKRASRRRLRDVGPVALRAPAGRLGAALRGGAAALSRRDSSTRRASAQR